MRLIRIALLLSVVFSFSIELVAVPAKPGLVTVRQADGTEIQVRIMGDEHSHYYLSEDGYLLVNTGDTYFYADADAQQNIVRSDIQARPKAERSAEARAFLSKVDMANVMKALAKNSEKVRAARAPQRNVGLFDVGFPSVGKQKGLVVLVEYQDVKFNLSDPYGYFSRMLNEDGFSDYGGTGCAAEYFRKSSMGKFEPEFDVYGPVTLSRNMSYYGGNDYAGNDSNPEKMAIEACQLLDSSVDFSEYDRDGDGFIDNVFVFYAGRGEASGGSANTVWPHAWNITAATSTPYVFDGVRLDRYACTNEWQGSRPDGVGTFIHEFSHVMGLPDLYATSYTSAFTPGAWSALDYGPYNNDGCTPPLYSVYERYALGWIEPKVLEQPETVTLRDISYNDACIVKTKSENEFFLFENRQQQGWDKYIPGHGMLVWHVDYNKLVWDRNTVNNDASHQYVDIEEADGIRSESTRAGDAFPGTAGVTSFTDDTNPSMKTWNGTKLGKPITEITETGGIIRFKVSGGLIPPEPVKAQPATDITAGTFVAHWDASDEAESYVISAYAKTKTSDGREMLSYVEGFYNRNVGNATSVKVEGLNPLTEYFYIVYVVNGNGKSKASNEMKVTTGEPTFDFYRPVAKEAENVSSTSFVANWELVDEAIEYHLDVYTKTWSNFDHDINGFDNGVKDQPEGWTTNSSQSYANTAYSGIAIPALRMASDGSYIESPVYSADIRSVSFWHRGSKAAEENSIRVSARNVSGAWTLVGEEEIENGAGGKTVKIDNLPEGTRAVRIEYSMSGTGSLAIDDIDIEWGGRAELNGQTFLVQDNNRTSLLIDNLQPSTDYYYRIMATNGTLNSLVSNEIKVRTKAVSTAISDVTTESPSVKVTGNSLVISGAEGQSIVVTDIAGRVICKTQHAAESKVVHLPSKGIYLIRIGKTKTIKIQQ